MLLLAVTSIKLVAEIALLALIGRGLLGLLAGAGRERNVFYQALSVLTRPVVGALRAVTPGVVVDRHLPLLAFIVLAWVWLGAVIAKLSLCQGLIGQGLCR